jgi:hypothetical protein
LLLSALGVIYNFKAIGTRGLGRMGEMDAHNLFIKINGTKLIRPLSRFYFLSF